MWCFDIDPRDSSEGESGNQYNDSLVENDECLICVRKYASFH